MLPVVRGTSSCSTTIALFRSRDQLWGRWVRLHQEDLCQSMAVLPQKKYQVDGGPSVRQIARLFRSLPDAQDRVRNAERFYDALVFSLASQGTDAHAKNYSLLLEGDHARLAPLYDLGSHDDLGSHAPYPTRGAALTLAMTLVRS